MSTAAKIDEILATVRQLKDRQDIFDCLQRESRGRDRQDSEQIASCWWPEGIDEHGAFTHRMPDYPERANLGHKLNFHMTSHNLTNHLCEIDGDTAYCETYVIGGLRWLDESERAGTTSIAFGRYLDQLEKRTDKDGAAEWRMLTRRCTIEMTADADASWLQSAAIKGFLKPLWSKDDPSYERPIVARPPSDGVRW
jgi:hypothetical protein